MPEYLQLVEIGEFAREYSGLRRNPQSLPINLEATFSANSER
jgi:hypothetical protein